MWTIIAAVGSIGALLVSVTVLIGGFVVKNHILNNDLVHISQDLKEINDENRESHEKIFNKLDDYGERISTIEGTLNK